MSDIRFNQWLHQSGTGGVSQDHIGNIGIGTTNPSIVVSAANTAVLNVGVITANNLFVNNAFNGDITGNVTGNISGATGTFSGNVDIADKIIHTGDTDTAMRFPADNTFAVDTAGSERLRIDSSGRLLMGVNSTSTTTRALFQGSSSGTGGSIFIARNQATPGNGSALGTIFFGASNHSQASRIASARDGGTWTAGSSQPSRIEFATTADGASTPTERLRITSGGDMGLGTASPTARLDVRRDDTDGKIAEFHQSTGYGIQIRSSESVATIRAEYNQALVFETGTTATERLRITSNGMVRVTDSASLSFGNNDDMRIFHDGGSANYIDVYNKDLYIRCNRDSGIVGGDIVLQPQSGENSAIFRDNGAVELYYNNTKKFETTSGGVDVSGSTDGVLNLDTTDGRGSFIRFQENGGQQKHGLVVPKEWEAELLVQIRMI